MTSGSQCPTCQSPHRSKHPVAFEGTTVLGWAFIPVATPRCPDRWHSPVQLDPGDQRKVEQLANWAAEDGDPDVVSICERALQGDVEMMAEALAWWPAWAKSQETL